MKRYTQKQIAEDSGTYKTAVYRYMKRYSIEPVSKQGNTLYYSEKTAMKAIKELKTETCNDTTDTTKNTKKVTNSADNELVTMLKEQLKYERQNNERLHKELEQAHKLIDQQQQLNLTTAHLLEDHQKEASQERSNVQKNTQPENGTVKTNESSSENKKQAKSFWSRIFKS